MANIRLILEYKGQAFSGWQVQPDQRTIQGELHKALQTVLRQDIASPIASGRTDAGVSAKRQVVCFGAEIESEATLRKTLVGVSSILKNEVSILSIEIVDDDFHPIRDVIRKQYSYTVWNHAAPPVLLYGSCKHVAAPLNLDVMRKAATVLIGQHDFSSFRGARCGAKSPVRVLEDITITKDGSVVLLKFQGRGFLKQMVRNMVGTLFVFGVEGECNRTMREILHARDRRVAGPTAEPYGLTLDWVEYPEGRL